MRFLNRTFIVLGFIIFLSMSSCQSSGAKSPEDILQVLLDSTNVELIYQVPLAFDTYHVQGLDLTERFYFLTSVDTKKRRAWLFKIDKKSGHLCSKKDLTDDLLIHPGGMQYDGQSLWVPNAEYTRESRTKIHDIDPNDLQIRKSFEVDDHIGAIASDGKSRLYGVNWDAKDFYTWDFDGIQLKKIASPTSAAYQDIKFYAGKLICSGHRNGRSVIDVIDPKTWSLAKRINLPRDSWKTNLSREGMAFDGNLYFLPDDGPDSHILIFALR